MQREFLSDKTKMLENLHHGAMTFFYQGKNEEAENVLAKVVEGRKQHLGHEDPDTLKSMYCLATVRKELGREEKAIEMMLEVVMKSIRVFGEEDRLTVEARDKFNLWNSERKRRSGQPQCKSLCKDHPEAKNLTSYRSRVVREQQLWKGLESLNRLCLRVWRKSDVGLGSRKPAVNNYNCHSSPNVSTFVHITIELKRLLSFSIK